MMAELKPVVTVLGAGSWGTALAILLSRNGHGVRLWGHDADAMIQLGRVYVLQKRYELAEFALNEAAEVFEKLPHPDRVGNIRLLCERAMLLEGKNKRDEAIKCLREALDHVDSGFDR